MKLSEAIRLGAMLAPKARDGFVDGEGRCALAGACEALGIPHILVFTPGLDRPGIKLRPSMNYAELDSRYPILLKEVTPPPKAAYLGPHPEVREVVWALNDALGWTREAIADWVATIEAQQEPETPLRVTELAEVV